MSGGIVALLDDIAAMARMAAASADDVAAATARASAKAAGVVVDDAAVTPQYVHGVSPARELPIIWKIALGSLRNKLLIILPAALLLSQFLPWVLTPLLMIGGCYLCFEGAEKVWEKLRGHHAEKEQPTQLQGEKSEKQVVTGAVRTDFILSTEIMVISLNEVASEPLVNRTIILIAVAVGITVLVYGVVALLVKMDDIGLAMTQKESAGTQKFGHFLVAAMPRVLDAISIIGTFAMLWVGGHILLVGTKDLGWDGLYGVVHHLEGYGAAVPAVGAVLGWLINTICSLILGLIVGLLIVGVMHLLPFGHGTKDSGEDAEQSAPASTGSAPGAQSGPDPAGGSHAAGDGPEAADESR
ncbi:DUF808 domain-containing protein [Brevibacterium luteolum]|uniref:DUF808 domain-containing protein n=1 Tax=Brevibacterium luteolum TaxID=199591 RepID=A0A849AVX4_9MICO|nr:DUF808 domain-containing protein [Brevibacterium luteolum]MBM7528987.1 putative DNA repair protein MutK [Brevibacterium luteolum]NNG80211.1 DUF808 domain-containing protein [Brevibacterium luteolum]